ncbi:MAG: hypothetical protein ACK5NF_04280 [Bacilli bacterium]
MYVSKSYANKLYNYSDDASTYGLTKTCDISRCDFRDVKTKEFKYSDDLNAYDCIIVVGDNEKYIEMAISNISFLSIYAKAIKTKYVKLDEFNAFNPVFQFHYEFIIYL